MKSAIKQLTFALGLGSILWTAEGGAAIRPDVHEFHSGAAAAVNSDHAKAADTLSKSTGRLLLAADDKDKHKDKHKHKKPPKCQSHHDPKCPSVS